jgi:hypothetical protein
MPQQAKCLGQLLDLFFYLRVALHGIGRFRLYSAFFLLGQKPAKVVFMNKPSSSRVGYGLTFSAEDRLVCVPTEWNKSSIQASVGRPY